MSGEHESPFPLEGGRAGDGGATAREPARRPAAGSVDRARRFRKDQTVAERKLWNALRQLKMNFRRQVPIGRYIADFARHESKLLIEIDGFYHGVESAAEKDAARTAWLVSEGFRVIRFLEQDVRDDTDTAVERILAETLSPPIPDPSPLRGKGEEVSLA
jgi:very-short-patch-repair endonuclease